jgi:hypothetical protein
VSKHWVWTERAIVSIAYAVTIGMLFSSGSDHHLFSGIVFDWNWTVHDIIERFNGNDIGDFATNALHFSQHGYFPPNSVYSFRMWAPGIYYLIAIPLILFGEKSAFLWPLAFMGMFIWVLLLTLLYEILKTHVWRVIGALSLGWHLSRFLHYLK